MSTDPTAARLEHLERKISLGRERSILMRKEEILKRSERSLFINKTPNVNKDDNNVNEIIKKYYVT